ncbi:MAG: hypothetical protein FAF03_09345 [Epsilonproteobacteria bacterium]|nr:hypothetical protein [Campylobacterota bacterium]
MLRILLTFTFFSAILLASSNYTVRLAVFKNAHKLQKAIDKYPPALKETVKTYSKNGHTYAYTLPTSDRATLKKLLPAYQKVFKDAYIQPTKLK